MKKLTAYNQKLVRIYVPIIIICFILAFLLVSWENYFTYLSFLFLIPLSILFFRAPKNFLGATKRKFAPAFGKIILLQIAAILLFYSVAQSYIHTLPIYDPLHEALAWHGVIQSFLNWGLFPWTTASLLAIAIHFSNSKQSPKPVVAALTFFTKPSRIILNMGARIFIRQAMVFWASISLVALSLILNFVIADLLGTALIYNSGLGLVIFALLLVLINVSFWEKIVKKFWLKNLTINRLLLLQSIFLTVIAVLMNLIFPWLNSIFALSSINLNLFNAFWFHPWQLFLWTWWLGFTPILTSKLVNYFQGLTIRQAISATLILPIILVGLILLIKVNTLTLDFVALNTLWQITLTIVGFLILLIYLYCSKDFDWQLRATFYSPSATKIREKLPLQMAYGILKTLTLILGFYFLLNMFLYSIFYFAVTAVCFYGYTTIAYNLVIHKCRVD